MNRNTLIWLVDVVSFIAFVFLVSTGVLLHYLLPPGSGRWSTVWSMNRHEWGDIHFIISAIFLCVLLLHLFLHWRALKHLLAGRKTDGASFRALLGIVGLVAVLLLAAAPLLSPVNTQTGVPGHGGWRHQHQVDR